MTTPTKGALICDIQGDIKEIVCDTKAISGLVCAIEQTCNPCVLQSELKALACYTKDLACTTIDLVQDVHCLEKVYHCYDYQSYG